MSRYPAAESPIEVADVELKNRIVRTAHGTNFPRRVITDRLIDYHEARARGGVALTVLEPAAVHASSEGRFVVHDDRAIPGYERLAERVHRHGMKVFQQLWHGGAVSPGELVWSASDVPSPVDGKIPVPMPPDMLDELIESYAAAAVRCRAGGLDGVEVHAAHGYLLGQFLSPLTNRRTDAYGGSLPKRMRLLQQILRRIRAAVGTDLAVGVRLTATECLEGGITSEETAEVASALESEGLVDYVSCTVGSFYQTHKTIGGMHEPLLYQVAASEVVTRAVRVPTIVAGRVLSMAHAEEMISSGVADLVSMVRATIADPDFVAKSFGGQHDSIRPCVSINQGCAGGIYGPRHELGCAVNPVIGHEGSERFTMTTAGRPKSVLVVGGGVAGLEAARTAAERGHQVQLVEATDQLGGQARIASLAPHRDDIAKLHRWQAAELARLGVTVTVNQGVDLATVRAAAPDAVIVATGARPNRNAVQHRRPATRIRGIDSDRVWDVEDVLLRRARTGPAVLIFDDVGTHLAIGAAELLLREGVRVCLATSLPHVGVKLQGSLEREPALERLAVTDGFSVETEVSLVEVAAGDVTLTDIYSARHKHVTAEGVVLAMAYQANNELATQVAQMGVEHHVVGDALNPRDLQSAVADGMRAGLAV